MKTKKFLQASLVTYLIIGMLLISLVNAVPVQVSAAGHLNASKLSFTCKDIGKTKKLTVTDSSNGKYKYNGEYYTIKWKSSNPKAVSVDANGNIKVIKGGNATIEAYFQTRFWHTIGTCSVTVSHKYKNSKTHKKPTLWQQGGTFETTSCVCGYKSTKNIKIEDFHYTENYVTKQMKKIVSLDKKCPLETKIYHPDDGNLLSTVTGFKNSDLFFDWLIKNKYYTQEIINSSNTTTGTAAGSYKNAKTIYGDDAVGKCEDGSHVIETLLSGYQQYECVHVYGKDNFKMEKDLKPGDVLKTDLHAIVFYKYTKRPYGGLNICGYAGNAGRLDYQEFTCYGSKPNEKNEIGYMDNATVWRLPNYN